MVIENLENKKELNPSNVEFAEVGGDKKFGKKTKETLAAAEAAEASEKESIKKLLEALKNRKDPESEILKDLIGADGLPEPKAIDVTKEVLKESGINAVELGKKFAQEKSESVKAEIIKNALAATLYRFAKKLANITDPLGVNREINKKLKNSLKNVGEYTKSQVDFLIRMLIKPTLSPIDVLKRTNQITNVVKNGPMGNSEMTETMIKLTAGPAAPSIIYAIRQANLVPSKQVILDGLLNPAKFMVEIYKQSLNVIKDGLEGMAEFFKNPVEFFNKLIPSGVKLPGEKENEAIVRLAENAEKGAKEIGNWMERNSKAAVDYVKRLFD